MPSEAVARLLQRLENVAAMSNGWTARCPAHADSTNSLSIGEGVDGRALIYCHAGCDFGEILAALGLRVRDLFNRVRGRS
jgi:hypothetical protein